MVDAHDRRVVPPVGRDAPSTRMSARAVPHVRKCLGQRLRELRQHRGVSQRALGERSGLSGKFIGEIERGEKSISVDSLYRVAVALAVPLSLLTTVGRSPHSVPGRDAEKIVALLTNRVRPAQMRRAHEILRMILRTRTPREARHRSRGRTRLRTLPRKSSGRRWR